MKEIKTIHYRNQNICSRDQNRPLKKPEPSFKETGTAHSGNKKRMHEKESGLSGKRESVNRFEQREPNGKEKTKQNISVIQDATKINLL